MRLRRSLPVFQNGLVLGYAVRSVGLGMLPIAWREHKRPFEQDKIRFEGIVSCIDPYAVEAFQQICIEDFSASHSDQLLHAQSEIDLIQKFEKSCIDSKLFAKERALVIALNRISQFLAWKSFYRRDSNTRRTFLWDSYDQNNPEVREKSQEIQSTIENYGKELDLLPVGFPLPAREIQV